MNVTKENTDELNAVLKVQIEKNDYDEKVTNALRDHRKKANMPGFRPGKVPFSLIKKIYRLPVLQDELNKIVSESISKYIVDENLKILGDPLPNVEKASAIDWDNQEDFEFSFDVALQPEIEVKLSKKDKAQFYSIKVEDEMVENTIKDYTKRAGTLQPADEIVKDEMIKADLVQIDEQGEIVEGGVLALDAIMSLERIKTEEIKNIFTGKIVGNTLTMNLKKAFDNDTEIASLLKIDKENTNQINADYKLTIKEISKFVDAEINQEFFDKIYGKDNVKSEEEFRNRVIESIKANFNNQADYKFAIDVREYIVEKTSMELPVDFLKRWLVATNNEKLTNEQIDKEFPAFEKDLKWQLIKGKLGEENEIKIEEEEVYQRARAFVVSQLLQYGMPQIDDDFVDNYTNDFLKKEEEKKRIYEQLYEEKVINFIKESIKIEEKEISKDEFLKLFENK